ncbi:MAG: tetratricopeptide repeat protein [Gemmatimonadetes bacterium]|nr:tetratricopeptide repeat protein [Gemmatimonadota bacterium]
MKTRIAIVCAALLLAAPLRAQSPDELMAAGQTQLQTGEFDHAVSTFKKVVSRDPSNFQAQYNLGYSYLQWGKYSNAIKEFRKALALNPKSATTYLSLADAYQAAEDPEEEGKALSAAVRLEPAVLAPRLRLAKLYEASGTLQSAKDEYLQVLQLNPGVAAAYAGVGRIAMGGDHLPSDAIRHFSRAIQIAPDSAEFWKGLASAHEMNSDKAAAIEAWNECFKRTADPAQKAEITEHIAALKTK